MRKMNKIVALSLVLAMALSMMASAASFKDQATINAELVDDINMMVALNVFSADGTGAGNFEPNTVLTRAQVAKMVYVLKNKGVDNGATSWTGLNIFTDVEAGAWYEGYVNYCASVGMIAGVGDNTFMPNKEITAVEFAKLLLVLNGYKADVEGYVGDKWFENIVADAEEAGIFEGYELPVKGNVTREWAAKLLNNAINVTMVQYSDGEAVGRYVTQIVNGETVSYPITFKGQQLNLVDYTGILVETPNIAIGDADNNEDGKNVYSMIDRDENGTADLTFKFDANPALLGQKVVVTVKGGLSASTNNSDVKVYGVVAHADVNVADTTVDAISISAIDGDSGHRNVKINGVTKKYDVDGADKDALTVYTDYVQSKTNAAIINSTLFGAGVAAGANDSRAVKLIDNNNDGIYEVAFIGSVAYSQVGYINPANHTVRFTEASGFNVVNNEEEYAMIKFVDTVAKDDIVKLTKDFSTGKTITVVEKVEKLTGAVSKVTNATTATIDGTEYKLSAHEIISDPFAFATDTKAKDYFIDGKYVVFTKAHGTTGSDIQTNIAFIIKADTKADSWAGTSKNMVEILKNDGTREILEYVADGDVAGAYTYAELSALQNRVAEYVMKDGKVALKFLTGNGIANAQNNATANSGVAFDKSAAKFYDGASNDTYLVTEDTYFFVVRTDSGNVGENKYAVVKASEMNGDLDIYPGSKFGYNYEGMPYLYFAVLRGVNPGGDSSTGFGIAAANVYENRNEDGDKEFSIDVTKIDGSVVTLKAATDIFSSYKNMLVEWDINATTGYAENVNKWDIDGYAAPADDYVAGAIKTLDEAKPNSVVLNTNTYMEIADDAKIYYVDAYKTASGADRIMISEADGLCEAVENSSGVLYNNILYRVNGSGKISHIICEVDGEAIATGLYR